MSIFEAVSSRRLEQIGEEPEVGRATRNVDLTRDLRRLAGIGHFRREKFVETRLDAVGDLVKQGAALGDGKRPPHPLEGAACGLDRRIDERLVGPWTRATGAPFTGLMSSKSEPVASNRPPT